MLELDPQLTALLAVVACALALIALLALLLVALRLRSLRRRYDAAFGDADVDEVLALLGEHAEQLRHLGGQVHDVDARASDLRELVRSTVSRVGLVRYDAFEDMGGALSFTAALLDERGDGVVISAINGRSETRCYAKPISDGSSEHNLSREEEAAIDGAVRGERTPAAPNPSRRRRRS